jgi:hypothetical protein
VAGTSCTARARNSAVAQHCRAARLDCSEQQTPDSALWASRNQADNDQVASFLIGAMNENGGAWESHPTHLNVAFAV